VRALRLGVEGAPITESQAAELNALIEKTMARLGAHVAGHTRQEATAKLESARGQLEGLRRHVAEGLVISTRQIEESMQSAQGSYLDKKWLAGAAIVIYLLVMLSMAWVDKPTFLKLIGK